MVLLSVPRYVLPLFCIIAPPPPSFIPILPLPHSSFLFSQLIWNVFISQKAQKEESTLIYHHTLSYVVIHYCTCSTVLYVEQAHMHVRSYSYAVYSFCTSYVSEIMTSYLLRLKFMDLAKQHDITAHSNPWQYKCTQCTVHYTAFIKKGLTV